MVAPPSTGGSSAAHHASSGARASGNQTTNGSKSSPTATSHHNHHLNSQHASSYDSHQHAHHPHGQYPTYAPHIPFSMRRAPPLDLSTVERKGQSFPARETSKRVRPYGLQEAPTFRPSEEDFKDPLEYMRRIAPEGRKYGICKIIPPDSWRPPFAIDTEKFHFRTRRQELNSVEGSTRTNLNYLDQLSKFHKQNGMNLNRFPSVDKRPLDLYKLKKAVEVRGGFDQVCKLKKWAEIGRDLGYSGKIMSSLSTSLKNSYQKWLHPYEEYLRVAKPSVQQQLEYEHGSRIRQASPADQSKRPQQSPPIASHGKNSPAPRTPASAGAVKHNSEERNNLSPALTPSGSTSGFTAVNAGGFTPVNLTPASFQPVNAHSDSLKREKEDGVARSNSAGSPLTGGRGYDPRDSPSTLTNGHGPNKLKRSMNQEEGAASCVDLTPNGDSDAPQGRRSKRQKKENVPTVSGSHMSLLRPLVPRMSGAPKSLASRPGDAKPGEQCEVCGQAEEPANLSICSGCDNGYHRSCLDPQAKASGADWHCPKCLVGTGEFGFEEGGIYGLRQFQEKANNFKESYFGPKMPFDPVLNCKRAITEDDVEREFWRLVESITETVEVEYGADIHSTTHGSGFPEVEKDPLNPYAADPWNLNILPLHPESLFRHIKSDISGMTVPWLYVGMCFSTFCWHNEDHYTYSANYQHFGATKTWYGIPGEDAERFERAMKEAVPELFEQQPDLLFQLVTLLPPDQLKKAGVNVFALDQRAGQFVITFPQAYHAGFNHGFNFNEAVNFAPFDWEPFGQAGVERLQEFRRQPCFSHDELLMTAAARDTTIKTAKWLAPALQRLQTRELTQRTDFLRRHSQFDHHSCNIGIEDNADTKTCGIDFKIDGQDLLEEEYQCAYCKAYSFLSRYRCLKSGQVMCMLHAGSFACCEAERQQRYTSADHVLLYRMSDEDLKLSVQKVSDKARIPEAWQEKLDKILEDEPKPALKTIRSLVSEGEKIPYELPGLADLKLFVDRCNEWVDEATNYITRKQQNRRKNDRVWRRGNSLRAAEMEERDRELRKIENIQKLLSEAEEISFDCPEITTLRERADAIADFQASAKTALQNPSIRTTQEFEDLAELGKGFNVDVPEVEQLESVVGQMKWKDEACDMRNITPVLQDIEALLKRAAELKIPENNEHLLHWRERKTMGEIWEKKAFELINGETILYHQLEALSAQAVNIPVSKATRAAIESTLGKQREAHRQIISMYERSQDRDYSRRPKYKAVRDVLDSLTELNGKPSGTLDLEKEVKRHEDWMRRGKKLFGKANASLHILYSHMVLVRDRNQSCFSLDDKPRLPVEPPSPPSRDATPEDDGADHGRDVFCLCRLPEAGLMIECEICHEWYHSKCLKIARGKYKEEDKYTCPICDYRVQIPRDAARPKLEDLQDWQAEILTLPFQPEEEDVIESIVSTAQAFRDFVRPYTNPIGSTSEEIPTLRFYLRKIEGADILLAFETNFFRQELYKWAPIAPEPPPILEYSLSTRKPRPTKQQKIMAQLGIENPADIPLQFRTKQHTFKQSRKSTDGSLSSKAPQPLQPAPQFSKSGPGRNDSERTNGTSHHHTASLSSAGGDRSAGGGASRAYRPPPPISTAHHHDPNFDSMFTTSPQNNSGNEFVKTSPPFTDWQSRYSSRRSNSPGPGSGMNSPPMFRPMSPLGGGGLGSSGPRTGERSASSGARRSSAPLDPGLFSASSGSFTAAALRDSSSGAQTTLPMASPSRVVDHTFTPTRHHHHHSSRRSGSAGATGTGVDLFTDFGAGASPDEEGEADGEGVRNEAGEALEGLEQDGVGAGGASQDQEEDGETQRLADEFLAD